MIKEKINLNPVGYLSKNEKNISKDQPDYGNWSYPDIRLELTDNDYYKLQKVAKNEGVDFFASPWDEKSLKLLIELKDSSNVQSCSPHTAGTCPGQYCPV